MSDQRGKADEAQPTTVKPPFDPVTFARESDSRVRVESAPPSARPTAPPPQPLAPAVARGSDVPVLAISREDLDWFELSSSARNLLRQVNGRDTVDALASLLRIESADLLGELEVLAREGLITWQ
jgi:hypothetical protein